jgi:hypothetical protein
MAGLVPAIHVFSQRLKEIVPFRIHGVDLPNLPRARPALD